MKKVTSLKKKKKYRRINGHANWNSRCISKIFFYLFIVWGMFGLLQKTFMRKVQKFVDELKIGAK